MKSLEKIHKDNRGKKYEFDYKNAMPTCLPGGAVYEKVVRERDEALQEIENLKDAQRWRGRLPTIRIEGRGEDRDDPIIRNCRITLGPRKRGEVACEVGGTGLTADSTFVFDDEYWPSEEEPRVLVVDGDGPWDCVTIEKQEYRGLPCGHDAPSALWEEYAEEEQVVECLECGDTWTPGYEEKTDDR